MPTLYSVSDCSSMVLYYPNRQYAIERGAGVASLRGKHQPKIIIRQHEVQYINDKPSLCDIYNGRRKLHLNHQEGLLIFEYLPRGQADQLQSKRPDFYQSLIAEGWKP